MRKLAFKTLNILLGKKKLQYFYTLNTIQLDKEIQLNSFSIVGRLFLSMLSFHLSLLYWLIIDIFTKSLTQSHIQHLLLHSLSFQMCLLHLLILLSFTLFLKYALEAINDSYIPAFPSATLVLYYCDCSGNLSQNILAACTFDMQFYYILDGKAEL